MKKFDIVIPVSYKDSHFLSKVLPWIKKNFKGGENIYILTSRRCFNDFNKSLLIDCKATLLDENKLIEEISFSKVREVLNEYNKPDMTGWYFQQFLKIGFARSPYAKDYYLVWDSDTIPLQDLSFFEEDTILYNTKKECHLPYFDTIKKLLGIERQVPYSFISEHMMIKTSIMNEMIGLISQKNDWWEVILRHCDLSNRQAFSEFETYGTYCIVNYPELYKPRQLMTLRCGGKLFGRQVTMKELELLKLDFDTASFERGQYPPFPRSLHSKIIRAWIEIRHKYLH